MTAKIDKAFYADNANNSLFQTKVYDEEDEEPYVIKHGYLLQPCSCHRDVQSRQSMKIIDVPKTMMFARLSLQL